MSDAEDLYLPYKYKYVKVSIMSLPAEGINPPVDLTDPLITVPSSLIEGLIQRAEELERAAQDLRLRLGGLMLTGSGDNHKGVPSEIGEVSPVVPAGQPTVRLFSQLEIAAETPFSKIEVQIMARSELVEMIRTKTSPYTAAFGHEMFSRFPVTEASSTRMPPCPVFEESPSDYGDYIKKYGKTIDWEEKDGYKNHKFSLTYLPGQLAPELVGFTVDSTEKVASSTGRTDTRMNTLEFVFARSEMVSLSMHHRVSLGSYKRPFRIMSDEHELTITLGAELSIIERRSYEKRPITYVYDTDQQVFVDTNDGKPDSAKPVVTSSACGGYVDRILAIVPTNNG